MDRLTGWNEGYAYYLKCFEKPCEGFGCEDEYCDFKIDACRKLAKYEDSGLCPEAINTMKADLEYWKQQSIEKCSEAGEIRIAIAERLEEIRTSIMITRQQLALEDNHFDQVILQWKIDQLQQQEEWLERTLSMKGDRNAGGQV